LTKKDQVARAALLERFKDGVAPARNVPEPFAKEVVSMFQDYWHKCLLGQASAADAETDLFHTLDALLAKFGRKVDGAASLDDLDDALHRRLREEGYYALTGMTPPLRELMLWRKETVRNYDVKLPESTQRVKVVFMDEFTLLGWAGYATADVYHSAGWTKPDALYCVQDSYDVHSESFKVSYLAHEAQHFADHKVFPDLEAPELEYRAKLVELSQAQKTMADLLDQFSHQTSEDRDNPHGFANLRLMRRMSQRLSSSQSAWQEPATRAGWNPNAIRKAALDLLHEDSRDLQARK
ncbi:MAG TPA: hypothetical protein VJS69_03015, partial [Candidatus Krumholzibacteria bacterium]|nr:hypothetical protein [Candidatus Krumholzibacteria bacterium]